ncbi:MAG: hypothetical protein HZR80_14820 [Candidatus Heimdallarchaeota archaeon]
MTNDEERKTICNECYREDELFIVAYRKFLKLVIRFGVCKNCKNKIMLLHPNCEVQRYKLSEEGKVIFLP